MLAVSIHYYSAHVIAHLHIAPMWAILSVQTQCFSHLKMYASYCTAHKGSIAALQLTCSWFIYSLGTILAIMQVLANKSLTYSTAYLKRFDCMQNPI